MELIEYPPCTTCKKAKKWLEGRQIPFTTRHIVHNPLTLEEIKTIHEQSGFPIKRLFNTNGLRYRELGLKDKLDKLTLSEAYALLASDGMLVRRPVLIDGNTVEIGFKEDNYQGLWQGL